MAGHPSVSRDEWVSARKALLAKEKEFTRLRDELSRARRVLPWEKVEKDYIFDGPAGKESLADLFGDKSQLLLDHFMFGVDWEEGCPNCSLMADHIDPAVVHLNQRDVAFVAVSRAPLDKIAAFRKRMGWSFKWVSSSGTDFNADYGVSFTPDAVERGEVEYNYTTGRFPSTEAPGLSTLFKDGPDLPRLFDLRPRRRPDNQRLQPARPHAEGPRRGRARLPHGLGAPPRPIRRLESFRTGRRSCRSQRISLPMARPPGRRPAVAATGPLAARGGGQRLRREATPPPQRSRSRPPRPRAARGRGGCRHGRGAAPAARPSCRSPGPGPG